MVAVWVMVPPASVRVGVADRLTVAVSSSMSVVVTSRPPPAAASARFSKFAAGMSSDREVFRTFGHHH